MPLTTVTASCRCPLCHDLLGSSAPAIVRCKTCRTPYHRFCWSELGGCSTLGCSNRRRRRRLPTEPSDAEHEPAAEPARAAPRPLPTFNLNNLSIAAHCPAEWDTMTGDDRARHCTQCDKAVFDLSELTQAESETLLTQNGVAPCVRLHKRRDGTVITSDCPEGLRLRFLRRLRRTGGLIGLILSATFYFFFFRGFTVVHQGAPRRDHSLQMSRKALVIWLIEHSDRRLNDNELARLRSLTLKELAVKRDSRLLELRDLPLPEDVTIIQKTRR